MTYKEQLLTKEWKTKRLEIITRDGGCCTKCGIDKYLQVHHLYYNLSKFAWDYPNDALVTLCRGCHKAVHGKKKESKPVELFYQLFTCVGPTLDRLSGSEKILFFTLPYLCDKENRIALVKPVKEELSKKSGLKSSTINNAITGLVKHKILIRLGSSMYRMNPRFVWTSDSKSREKMLLHILENECADLYSN